MTATTADSNLRPSPDQELVDIARYVTCQEIASTEAYDTARYCLMDSLACALLALRVPACTRLLGPLVPGTVVPLGARVPGTPFVLDPWKAAFDIGALVRWLDFNDTWLAAEWGHPSDNLGALLAVADFLSRRNVAGGQPPLTVRTLLTAMIKAYEIQGVLALENSFNRVGLDHVILVKVASTAVVTQMLGGSQSQVVDALSHAWVDGHSLRTYRHAPNTVSRKSWAAGDAASRAVRLAMLTLAGEPGLPSALTAPRWGFGDVLFQGGCLQVPQPYGSYVMENVLFKTSFPAEFHAQTAVECALQLHPLVRDRLDKIERVELRTQEPAVRIISKTGPLHNPADRDHCLQYMVAVPLLYGRLDAECYEDAFARDPRLDALRVKMIVAEEPQFTRAYYDPNQRAIGNAVQVFFRDGACTPLATVHFPLGHRLRRAEGIPLLLQKFQEALATRFPVPRAQVIYSLCQDHRQFEATAINELMDLLVA
ncbi:MAG: bifunctional 2-methylcitrate dehydratase/aconitate hydratase [Pirellulaceae bacterium]